MSRIRTVAYICNTNMAPISNATNPKPRPRDLKNRLFIKCLQTGTVEELVGVVGLDEVLSASTGSGGRSD